MTRISYSAASDCLINAMFMLLVISTGIIGGSGIQQQTAANRSIYEIRNYDNEIKFQIQQPQKISIGVAVGSGGGGGSDLDDALSQTDYLISYYANSKEKPCYYFCNQSINLLIIRFDFFLF